MGKNKEYDAICMHNGFITNSVRINITDNKILLDLCKELETEFMHKDDSDLEVNMLRTYEGYIKWVIQSDKSEFMTDYNAKALKSEIKHNLFQVSIYDNETLKILRDYMYKSRKEESYSNLDVLLIEAYIIFINDCMKD
jgi:hypothetical protein